MAVSIHHLSNGVPVLVDQLPHMERADVGIYFGVGGRYETAKSNGAAHFLEHMAFKGTKNRDVRQLIEDMEDLGAHPNAYTGSEGTMYYMAGLGGDSVRFAQLLSDIAAYSTLPKSEMEIERGAIIQEIGMYADRPSSVVRENAMMTAFPGQPLGATILGPVKNIETFKRAVLNQFRKQHYHAGNMVISAAGNVDPAAILKAFEKGVGHMPAGKRSTFQPGLYVGGAHHEERATRQLQLAMMFKAAASTDADVTATQILGSVLGGGISSRLFTEIREKRGLVYGIGAGHGGFQDTGIFSIMAGTGEAEVAQLMPVLCDELKKICENDVTDKELARAKASFKVGMAMGDGDSESRMHAMPKGYLLRGRIRPMAEILQDIDSVTKQSVRDAANKIFSGVPTVATVGPGKNVMAFDKVQARLKL